MITVTEKAAARLEEIIGQEHGKESAVRLYLSGVGWGGPRLGLALEESIDEQKDRVVEAAGFKFVFEKDLAAMVEGRVIDYRTGFFRRGFSITPAGSGRSC